MSRDYENYDEIGDRVDADVSTDFDVDVGDDLGFDLGAELETPGDDRARPFGAKLALSVVVALAVVLGVAGAVAADLAFLAVPVAALGGAGVARATRALDTDANVDRAEGSLGVMVGVVVLVGSIAATGRPVPGLVAAAAGVAAASVGFGALVGVGTDPSDLLRRAVRRSAVVLVVATVVSGLLYSGVVYRGLASGLALTTGALGVNAFVALVALQVEAILVIGLVQLAVPILDDWTPDDGGVLDVWEENGVDLANVHPGFWVLLGIQVVLALLPPVYGVVDWVLANLRILGTVVDVALTSGILHLPVAVVGLLAGLVLVGRGLQWTVVSWAGREPPRALANAAGGFLLSAVVLPVGLLPPVVEFAAATVPEGATDTVLGAGPGTVVLGGAALLLGVAYVGLAVAPGVAAVGRISDSSGNFAAGGVLLLLAGALTVVAGGHPVLAFVSAAAGVFVWDLGENAASLVDQVGPNTDVREAEVTHAAGSLVVGLVGVALAVVAYYLLGVVRIPTPASSSQSFLAMLLALLALLAFANLVTSEDADA